MSDEKTLAKPTPGKPGGRNAAVVGGAGVVTGAGVSTALFATLGVKDLLAHPQSLAYALVIFSFCALFVLVAALFTIQVSRAQRPIVLSGVAVFAATALLGSGIIFYADANRPVISFTAHVDPEWVLGDGKPWVIDDPDGKGRKLRLVYRAGDDGVASYSPLMSNTLTVAKGGVISLRIEGIEDLLEQYRTTARKDGDAFRTHQAICRVDPKLACETFVARGLQP